jgi:hypothetical protein
MSRLKRTDERYTALAAVHADQVRYHSTPAYAALGYAWSDSVGGQMADSTRRVLHDLWAADLVEVETYRLFAQHGHRVTITTQGYLLLMDWAGTEANDRLASAAR